MNSAMAASISPGSAADVRWHVIVVGAGPAGALAALLLARQGRSVLLVDKSPFPREKPCGCCLNKVAADVLRQCDIGDVLPAGAPLHRLLVRYRQREISANLPESYCIPRANLDAAIVHHAMAAGAGFIPACSAHLLPSRDGLSTLDIVLRHGQDSFPVRGQLVLACDGIRDSLLDAWPQCAWRVARNSWMGAAATLDRHYPFASPGAIAMHVGNSGYVGAVAMEDGRTHLAAALCPSAAKRAGGPAALMGEILRSCGIAETLDLDTAGITGTPLLTRSRRMLGAHRILAAGDACGYVEPFTGEGMAWALQSARQIATMLPESLDQFPDELPRQWTRCHARLLGRRQLRCHFLRFLLHHPMLCSGMAILAHHLPSIPRDLIGYVNGDARLETGVSA